jgi:hypothetical protein
MSKIVLLVIAVVGVLVVAFAFSQTTAFDEVLADFGGVRVSLTAVKPDGSEFQVSGSKVAPGAILVEGQPITALKYALDVSFDAAAGGSGRLLPGTTVEIQIIISTGLGCLPQVIIQPTASDRANVDVSVDVGVGQWKNLFQVTTDTTTLELKMQQACPILLNTTTPIVDFTLQFKNKILWLQVDTGGNPIGVSKTETVVYEIGLTWDASTPVDGRTGEPTMVLRTDGKFVTG